MSEARDLYQAGRLTDAISAAGAYLRNKPGDISERWLLCELLCFAGDLERADKHLDLLTDQAPAAVTNAALFRQLLRAEGLRHQFFQSGRVPELLSEPDEELRQRLTASVSIRQGASAEAARLLERAEGLRRHPSGLCDDRPFDDFRDADDLTASVFELLTPTGKYLWVPITRVRSVQFRPLSQLRDLLWRQAYVSVDGGPEGEVYFPALYPGSHTSGDERVRLGRATDWVEAADAPVRGVGQRVFVVGDEARGVGEIGNITFRTTGAG